MTLALYYVWPSVPDYSFLDRHTEYYTLRVPLRFSDINSLAKVLYEKRDAPLIQYAQQATSHVMPDLSTPED